MNHRYRPALLIGWLLITCPFTFLGYGSDGDAWLVARAAAQIWQSRQYVASRTTGFPLFESTLAPLVHLGGWRLSNLLPLMAGVGFIQALFYLSDRKQFVHQLPTIISLAFLPVVVKNAASTMDYLPALAILMWSYCLLIDGPPLLCAVLVGAACGFRPSSGLFVLPCLLYTLRTTGNARLALKMLPTAAAVGTMAFSPSLFTYGLHDPHGLIQFDLRTKLLIGGYNSLALFGIVP